MVAVFPGTVVEASRMPVPYHSKADAYTVVIEHGGGWRSTYGLLAQILVAKGDQVSRGKVIGRAGMIPGGEGAGEALLHFALARDGASVDPRAWLP
ncbi:MAG: M23 family metallopeptidase [Firmicutes bacterium]|nr:M23 family metallopeptidase [Bacillota bacterium]